MCGLAGFFSPNGFNVGDATSIALRMRDKLIHRGPDDAGIWLDEDAGIVLTHRRLSILDLSPAGSQPMQSGSGRYVIAFNGEIYNHLEIRGKLQDEDYRTWRGQSDTETLLAAVENWGIENALRSSTGMFALAIWDRSLRKLYLARDRVGEKPLYYGWQGSTFIFGSELKALRAHPSFKGELFEEVLPQYLRLGYIPSPWSIWKNIFKVIPGTILEIDVPSIGKKPHLTKFWSLKETVESALANPFSGTETDAIDELDTRLKEVVSRQMVSDVPLGAFLSGGIDSTTIAAIMQSQSSLPVNTFTIGFEELEFNEAVHAKEVANCLGTKHTEYYVSTSDAMNLIPELGVIYDEPFADSSQIPTYILSKLTRKHVTVALSGDGGDEVFGGYLRYLHIQRHYSMIKKTPSFVRKALQIFGGNLSHNFPMYSRFKKILNVFGANPVESLYQHYQSQSTLRLSKISTECSSYFANPEDWPCTDSYVAWMMFADTMTYLPNDILVKVDRASMAASLETRIPFLDHSLIEFAWRLPMDLKIRNGNAKWILKRLLNRYVPSQILDRPKMGFAIPIARWLRSNLREWGEALLNDSSSDTREYLYEFEIKRLWKEHQSGVCDHSSQLWYILQFKSWLGLNKTSQGTI